MKTRKKGLVEPRSTICQWCGEKNENSRDNRAHEKSCSKKPCAKSFTCHHCDEKTFGSLNGLQQHQRLARCAAAKLNNLNLSLPDRECPQGYNTPENFDGPMPHHSARDFCMKEGHQETAAPPQGVSFSRKPKLKLPPANDKDAWSKIDIALENAILFQHSISPTMTHQQFDENMESANLLCYSTIEELEGSQERVQPKSKVIAKRSKGPRNYKKLRKQKNALRSELKKLQKKSPIDQAAVSVIRSKSRKLGRALRKIKLMDETRQKTITAANTQKKFDNDHYKFAKSVFSDSAQASSDFTFGADVAEKHFQNAYSDPKRSNMYTPPPGLKRPPKPSVAFQKCTVNSNNLRSKLKPKSNNSSPGPNGLSYLVYKCSKIMFMFLLLCLQWVLAHNYIPRSWGWAFMILLVKDPEKVDHPQYFRNIACANTDGKMFWTMMSSCLMNFCIGNNYFRRDLQKGFIPGIAGCVEHSWTFFQALRNAKLHKRQIIAAWYDLKNAFGSVRHNLIQFALQWYHVPDWFCQFVLLYYDTLFAMVTTDNWDTLPFAYGTGAFQGCVASSSLFLIAYQIVLDFVAQFGTEPYTFKIEHEQHAPRQEIALLQQAYADDHASTNCSRNGAQHTANCLQKIYDWTDCLVAKPTKCWSLGLCDRRFLPKDHPHHGKSYGAYDPGLTINEQPMNFLSNGSFKYVGRKIYATLKERDIMNDLRKKFESWMAKVDSTPITGASKAWIYEHMILAFLRWPFMIHDFTINMVSPLQDTATRYLKSWYKMKSGANARILYLPRKVYHGLGLTSIETCLKTMQLCTTGLVKHSQDPITSAVFKMKSEMDHHSRAHRWKPTVDLELFERALRFQDSFAGQSSRLGLGYRSLIKFKDSSLKIKRKMVAEHCKREEAHKRKIELLALARNSDFVKWDERLCTDRDWTSQIFGMSPKLLAFTLNAQANTLPSPSNLRRWGFHASTHHCTLCGKLGVTAKHMLSNCVVALKGGRLKWRHDNVLRVIYPDLVGLVNAANHSTPKLQSSICRQPFVRAGANIPSHKSPQPVASLLDLATDWILLVDDVPRRTVFPVCTGVSTSERPDVIIFSKAIKTVIWGELTVPLEENIEAASNRKSNKYSKSDTKSNELSLADECKRNGWVVHDFTFEVGSLGWVAHSTRQFLYKLGFRSSHLNWLVKRISKVTMRSSYLIWCCRKEKSWEPPELVPLRSTTSTTTNPPRDESSPNMAQQPINPHREAALNFLAANISISARPKTIPSTSIEHSEMPR
jgi:hypothetical protein